MNSESVGCVSKEAISSRLKGSHDIIHSKMHCQSMSSDGGLLAREPLPLGKRYSGRGLAVDPVVSSLDGEKRAEDFPAKQYLSSDRMNVHCVELPVTDMSEICAVWGINC